MKDIATVIRRLKSHYRPFQRRSDAFYVLIFTLLSQRAKDSVTIPITEKLFRQYKNIDDFLKADRKEFEKIIRPIGFYRQKAKRIKEIAKILTEKYNKKVPSDFDSLISLPGVGRKTANCVLSYAFGKPAIAVDTHVHRISNRLGWAKTQKPEETEEALKKIIPVKYWSDVNTGLVQHGQQICFPRNPRCEKCFLNDVCEYGKKKK